MVVEFDELADCDVTGHGTGNRYLCHGYGFHDRFIYGNLYPYPGVPMPETRVGCCTRYNLYISLNRLSVFTKTE